MSESTTESADEADADTDEETENDDSFEYYPQVTQHPTTIIEGDIVDLVTGADIDDSVEDTGSSFGVVFENAEVVGDGTIWQNRDIPEGFDTTSEYNDAIRMAQADDSNTDYVRGQEVTDDAIEAAQERLDDAGVDYADEDYDSLKVSGTDFKVADPSDKAADVQEVDDNVLGIDVGGGMYGAEEVDEFDADRIMVWYGGMSGQFVGRGLDFNGMPFARYTDDGYLVKGLFQVAIGWRGDADVEAYDNVPTTDRSELATDLGRPPRVARPPVLRDDIDERSFVAIGRYQGGDMFEVQMGREADDYDAILDALRSNDDPTDLFDELEMKYDQEPEDTLTGAFEDTSNIYSLYHGEGWQDKPDNAQDELSGGSGGGDFDTPDVEVDDDAVDHPTEQEVTFGEEVAEKLAGTGVSPEDAIFPDGDDGKVDLDGLVAMNSDQFQVTPDADAIREVVYENVNHLSTNDLNGE